MPQKKASKTRAAKQRQHAARYSRKVTAEVSDIGDIPKIVNPKRRAACRRDLFRFLTTYFPESTGLSPLSDDHRRVIERLQTAILTGGTFTNAVFRGFAKTTIAENAVLWATLYGHRRFPVVFGASADASESIIDSIKMELAENDLLYEDFPEVCHPVRALENKSQRCASQTCKGELTHIEWTANMIVLPSVKGSLAGGAIIATRPMMGAGRGMKFKRPDGTQQRPDFVLLDDPQTDESAASPLQTNKRLDVFRKSILKLGGHNSRIACVVNGTVIEQGDMIEQLLDPKKFPAFQGERIKMVKRWADEHETLWLTEYREIRNRFDPALVGDQHRAWSEATAFYERNREKMDRGCIVAWAHCFDPKLELSAIQHAYNMLIDDGEDVFASECQNEPRRRDIDPDAETLTPDGLAKQLNALERGVVPINATRLVAHIDVQHNVLFWTLVGMADDLGGAVTDYGAYPDQRRAYFAKREAKHTIQVAAGTKDLQAAAYAAIRALIADLGGRTYIREDGTPMKIVRGLVDASDGRLNKTILRAVKDCAHPTIFMPSYGRYFGINAKPMSEWAEKDGAKNGLNWHRSRSIAGEPRHLTYHTNYWKSVVSNRITLAANTVGTMTIFGREAGGKPASHDMLFDHYTAEYGKEIEDVKSGRRAMEYRLKPNRDNDLWDNLIGCYVAASEQGASPFGASPGRKKVKLSELQKQRRTRAA